MLKIEIDNRIAIPVRLIPFVTGWRLSPDVVVSILAEDNEIYRVCIPSYNIGIDGKYHPMLTKEWDTVRADIDALSNSLDATETSHNQNYPIWRRESIKILPPATFVWLDELEVAWNTAFSKERMDIVGERPGDRDLNLAPTIPSDVAGYVYEGFNTLLIFSYTPSISQNGATIRLEELHYYLMLDPFYGVESDDTEPIINSIYRDNAGNQLFQQFSRRFSLLPCKTDRQRHLIYLWCGLMGLPAYRDNQPLGWQREEFLDHWTEDFYLRLDDIERFLRAHSWPLPAIFFPDAVDNTERKMALSAEKYHAAFHDFSVVLPQLEKERAEIDAIQPESMKARQEKKAEKARIEQQIAIIKGGQSPSPAILHPADEAQYRFIFTGGHWSITYEGQTSTFSNTKGLRYIAWLIRNQGREILVSDLFYAINPPDNKANDPIQSMSIGQFYEMGLSVGGASGAGKHLDQQAKEEIHNRLLQIDDLIEIAKETGDRQQLLELEDERVEIRRYLSASLGKNNQPRSTVDHNKRMADAVGKCIRTDRKRIGKHLPLLAKHLECIKLGSSLEYNPVPAVNWEIR